MDGHGRLAKTFVGLADSLVEEYDVLERAELLVDSVMTLLPIAAAGIMLGDAQGELYVFASSSEQTRLLQLQELESDMGPCRQTYRTGQASYINDLTVDARRRPAFARRAAECGFRSMVALPMRLREERVGALNLFGGPADPLSTSDVRVGQALADVATIGILQRRVMARSERANQQLRTALNSRIVIEQAKGMLAERGGIDLDGAYLVLRGYSRRSCQRLTDVARAVVDGADTTALLTAGQE